jgi:hypothetical protein
MPCTYDGLGPSSSQACNHGPELDKLTRMLCSTLGALSDCSCGTLDILDAETKEWWAKHEEKDHMERMQKEREEREAQAREVALAKLTPHEKILLGLKR